MPKNKATAPDSQPNSTVNIEIVMYARQGYCPHVALARDLLTRYQIPYRELDIKQNPTWAERVQAWTGYLSVPTLIIAETGQDTPRHEPSTLPAGQAVRGLDRGDMLTEPNNRQLEDWLHKHGFLAKPYNR
jgi:glutaredoxin